ncbi:fungal-specific transcription factor domain-containing protein [Microdochium trichocladiopsis]|uniref:Fungal-specific transcription factor domain-containing protein n=1 Tax=Microdochium trichocladiopsis TaxID=1682393 RepID=A0A9P8XRZ5_9PEZI|nr:fungal-specific transcription factor domain-containing protein [Microdochium trichocladiopsis]KAH7014171.1 fungal-specific transcription factor domain-containing protein [Microdochium trichocladiopsis]
MTAVLNDGEVSNEYFGSSSVGSFTRQLRAAVSGPTSSGASQPQNNQPDGAPSLSVTSHQAGHGFLLHRPSTSATPYNHTGGISSSNDDDSEPHEYVLPSRKQADRLVHLYWYYVDGLYPFLDRETFQACYESLFSGTSAMPSSDERIFVSLLNSIFALATELQEGYPSEQRAEASKEYYTRAQQSLRFNVWDGGSVQVVQCLLLMGQYLQSTNHPHQTWMVIGAAIRIAQGLGLHLPETSARLGDARDRELVRRIWHGCILMDRMLALTHGRPSMVSSETAEAVPQPLMLDVGALDPSSSHSHSMAAAGADLDDSSPHKYRFAFFVKTLDLYRIIHRVLKAFYSTPSTNSRGLESHKAEWLETDQGEADAGKAIMIDNELTKWEAGLPAHLQLEAVEGGGGGGGAAQGIVVDEITRRQIVILRFRCLHARILLLRPMLARYCLGQPTPDTSSSPATTSSAASGLPVVRQTLSTRVLQQSALVCVETALETVALMRRFLQHDGTLGLLPAWWYRLFYIYTAGAVLMAARLRPRCFPAREVAAALDDTMAILREHEQFGLAAKRCVVALEILSGKIGEKTSGGEGGGGGGGSRGVSRRGSAEQQQQQQTNSADEQQAALNGRSDNKQQQQQQQQQHTNHNNTGQSAHHHHHQHAHGEGPGAQSMLAVTSLHNINNNNNNNTNNMRSMQSSTAPSSRSSFPHSHHMFDVDAGGGAMAAEVGLDSLFFDMDDTQWLTYVPADF